MTRATIATATLSVTLCAAPCAAQAPPPAPACSAVAGFHLLDFWVGDWDVYVGKRLDGRDVVAAVLASCAVTEEWTGSDGSRGKSLFYYNSFIDRWTQVWVTEQATQRGGLKEKTLVWHGSDASVRFQGLLPGAPASRPILDRTTLTPLDHGRVRQVIEESTDGGTTWTIGYYAIYVPHGSPAPQ